MISCCEFIESDFNTKLLTVETKYKVKSKFNMFSAF